MDEINFENWLKLTILAQELEDGEMDIKKVATFEEVGICTYNRGLVVRTEKGEFQVTIVKSK